MAKHYEFLIIILVLKFSSAKDVVLKLDVPPNCDYISKYNNGVEEYSLQCFYPARESLIVSNYSTIPVEHTVSLGVKCNDSTQVSEQSLLHLYKLRELTSINCKIPLSDLSTLHELKNLTIETKSLNLKQESFVSFKQLEKLDLSFNNIKTLPDLLFCSLTNLVYLNLSFNNLNDISDLCFENADKFEEDRSLYETVTIHNTRSQILVQSTCNLDIQTLDLSYNNYKYLPSKSLSSLRRLHDLNINNNVLTSIAEFALNGLKVLKTFDASNNHLIVLPPGLFKDCSDIREIKLQNNSLEIITPDLFSGLEHLLILNLSKNRIKSSTLNLKIFSGLIRLVLLDLSNNRISTLNPDYFKDLYTLQILNLKYNLLEFLPSYAFSPMNNLHTLILSYNKLSILEPYSFNGLFALSLLSLDNNMLHTLHKDSLRNCSALQDLNLNGNLLRSVPSALQNMRLLRTVDLGENLIEQVSKPGFVGMNNLYGLRLIGNQIKNISKQALSGLPNLQILNLSKNKIKEIESGTFDKNVNLQAIRLDANLLVNITGLFTKLPNLIWLNVSDNQLNYFDYTIIPNELQWLDLHKNKIQDISLKNNNLNSKIKLKTIDISYNLLTNVNSKLLPSSIELVLLNDNLISTVNTNSFINKTNLTRVDLYANQIIKMDLNALILTPVNENHSLPEFYIGGNPFQCDCTMEWLQRINKLNHLRQHPKVMDLESVYCKLPYSREKNFIPLIEADSSHFVCEYKTHCFALCHCCDFDACDCEMTCPQNCTCYHDQSWSAANIVDCSSANHVRVPERIPMDATEVYLDGNVFGELTSHSFIGRKNLRVLYVNDSKVAAIHNHTFSGLKRLQIIHLENNYLKEIHGFELQCLEELKEIYLQNNLLNYIDNRTFLELKKLKIIRLDGNRLHNFPVWHLTINPSIIKITLADNNWSCHCQYMQKFRIWLSQNVGKVHDYSKITCVLQYQQSEDDSVLKQLGPYLADFNSTACSSYLIGVGYLDSHFHEYPRDYILLILAIITAFIITILIIFTVTYNRKKIRIWMYSKCGIKKCFSCKNNPTSTLEEIDSTEKTRQFDAYISYSVKDENFVIQLLSPGLEPQYRLRLHYRDFSVGSYIADTILEGVESSKRTIIILSQNFLSSEWCRFEFKSALREALLRDMKYKRDKNTKRLIVILYGDLPARDLDPDIRVYLNKTAICVKWGDVRFWEKLRYAMPEIRNRIQEKDKIKGSLYYCCQHSDAPPTSSAGQLPSESSQFEDRTPRGARSSQRRQQQRHMWA